MDTVKTVEGDYSAGNHYHHNMADRWHDHHDEYAKHHHHHDEYAEEEHEHDGKYASKGTAGAALGLGIAGTALGIWNAWKENNDRRYGRRGSGYDYDDCDDHGRRGRGCGCEDGYRWRREERHERHYELEKENELATVKAALAQQSAERFAEQGDFKNYRTLSRMIEEENEELARKVGFLSEKVCELQKCCAVSEAKAEGKFEVLKEGLRDFKEDLYGVKQAAKEELRAGLSLEAERRECGDRELHTWANCTFAKNKKVIPLEDICPRPMMRFNTWDEPRGVDDFVGCCEEREGRKGRKERKSEKE